jgi:hypothetical protein
MGKFAFPPKKDMLGQKHNIIKKVPNNYIYLGAAGVIVIGGLYYAATNGMIQIPGMGAASVTVNAFPVTVKTGENVNITGSFTDSMGRAATVLNGYVAVFEDVGQKVYEGNLGFFVSSFKTTIPTTNWRDGSYTCIVSDSPIVGPGIGAAPTASSMQPTAAPLSTAGPGGTNMTLT